MPKRPKHLVIGDPHAHYAYDNRRFEALGNFIVEEKPDVIICIGDFADLPSLSSYDTGTAGYEGRRYAKDIETVLDAQERLFAPLSKLNAGRRPVYLPRKVMTLGNHDDRADRVWKSAPQYEGTVGVQNLQYDKFGWEVYPYQQPVTIDGIAYCHFFVSGVAGRPIAGENIGKTLCLKLHGSSVQGHSHIYDHSERTTVKGTKIFGLSCGCYTHPDMIEDWNRATAGLWWRGVVVLGDLDGEGYYDSIQAITQRKLMRDFL